MGATFITSGMLENIQNDISEEVLLNITLEEAVISKIVATVGIFVP